MGRSVKNEKNSEHKTYEISDRQSIRLLREADGWHIGEAANVAFSCITIN